MNVSNGQFTTRTDSDPRRFLANRFNLVLIVFVITIYINAAFASTEESGRYHIVYAADNELCADLVTLINTDIEKYGRVQYEKHAEFVQWKNEEGIDEYRRTPNDPIPWAETDIDNNGEPEVLYKLRSTVDSTIVEFLYIERNLYADYPARQPLPSTVSGYGEETLKRLKQLELIDFYVRPYPLRQAPTYKEFRYRDGPLLRSPSFGRHFVYLNVYKRKGVNFVTAHQYFQRDGEWFIVLRYKTLGVYKDVCYFQFKQNK